MRYVPVTLLLWTLLGCAPPEKEEPVVVLRPMISWSDITAEPVDNLRDGFRTMLPEGTKGLFPARIAVARVAADFHGQRGPAPGIKLNNHPPTSLLFWQSAVDHLRAISEIFPLDAGDLGGARTEPATLVSSSRLLTANICLLYGEGDLSAQESEVKGVLYRAADGQLLAAIHAHARVENPETVPQPPEYAPADQRHIDAQVLAETRFQELVVACLRSLMQLDEAADLQAPRGWVPREPLFPRVWPPQPVGAPPPNVPGGASP